MSNSCPTPKSPEQQRICDSDVSSQDPVSENLVQETPNPSDPSSQPIPDPLNPGVCDDEGDGAGGGEPAGEGQEQETQRKEAVPSDVPLDGVPPTTYRSVPVSDVCLPSPSFPNPRRGAYKRKKGKAYIKKQQSIQRKLPSLMLRLNPIPFKPLKVLNFSQHEQLLKKLGLWDFVKIEFDKDLKVNLIGQLIATYDPKLKVGYVNCFRITLHRADFAHAFKLPLKKKTNVGSFDGVNLDEDLGEDSIGFIVEFVSEWMLLHDDTWLMSSEVMQWLKLIKDGHPEKVDWAGMLRFMVEKELLQAEQLGDCYYASHLQKLIKFKREEVFDMDDRVIENLNLETEGKEETEEASEGDVMQVDVGDDELKESSFTEGPNIELTLGQEGETEENLMVDGMMEAEKEDTDNVRGVGCIEEDEDEDEGEKGGCDEEGTEVHEGWFAHGKNNLGEHFLQPCNVEDGQSFGVFEEQGEEEREMEENDAQRFDAFPIDDDLHGEGVTGNLLQAMERNKVPFNSKEHLTGPSSLDIRDDMHHVVSSKSFYNLGKRVIDHDNDNSHHPLTDGNKRLRINDSWNQKPVDFGMCMEQIQQTMVRAAMIYGEKESELEQSNMNQQLLVDELQKRDTMIDHLHKTRLEEIQRKDGEIYRLERELYLMGSVLDGYRKALKASQKVFAEYRLRARLPEEPTYKDAGPGAGGLMLSTAEIEKIRQKREEYNMNCLAVERLVKEVEENISHQMDEFVNKVDSFDKKLAGLEADAKILTQIYAKQRVLPAEEELAKPFPNE